MYLSNQLHPIIDAHKRDLILLSMWNILNILSNSSPLSLYMAQRNYVGWEVFSVVCLIEWFGLGLGLGLINPSNSHQILIKDKEGILIGSAILSPNNMLPTILQPSQHAALFSRTIPLPRYLPDTQLTYNKEQLTRAALAYSLHSTITHGPTFHSPPIPPVQAGEFLHADPLTLESGVTVLLI